MEQMGGKKGSKVCTMKLGQCQVVVGPPLCRRSSGQHPRLTLASPTGGPRRKTRPTVPAQNGGGKKLFIFYTNKVSEKINLPQQCVKKCVNCPTILLIYHKYVKQCQNCLIVVKSIQ